MKKVVSQPVLIKSIGNLSKGDVFTYDSEVYVWMYCDKHEKRVMAFSLTTSEVCKFSDYTYVLLYPNATVVLDYKGEY